LSDSGRFAPDVGAFAIGWARETGADAAHRRLRRGERRVDGRAPRAEPAGRGARIQQRLDRHHALADGSAPS